MEQRTSGTSMIQQWKAQWRLRQDLKSLTRGLTRLQNWRTQLQGLMKQVRLRTTESPLEPLEIPGLPLTYTLPESTLLWGLAMLEDLHMMLLMLEEQTNRSMQELSKDD